MTISSSFSQQVSFQWTANTTLALSLSQASATPRPAATPRERPAPASDTVALSPEATATAVQAEGDTAKTPITTLPKDDAPDRPSPSRAERRADALLNALDTDKDGSITEQEFTEGALAILRRGRTDHGHRHVHGEDGERHGDHESRGVGRLERRLERVFDRVDANDDGSIDKDELTRALSRHTHGRRTEAPAADPAPPAPTGPPTPAPEAVAAASAGIYAMSVTAVTFVSVAVQQYTAVGGLR